MNSASVVLSLPLAEAVATRLTSCDAVAADIAAASPPPQRPALNMTQLFQQHWTGLCGFLYRLYGAGPPEPEDVAQEAFSVLSGLKDSSHIEQPKAFLYKVAINIALKARRTEQQMPIKLPIETLDLLLSDAADPEQHLQQQQGLQQIASAIAGLTEKQRFILLASRIQGKTYSQIAAQTGWSLADISRQLHQVLDLLLKVTEPGMPVSMGSGQPELSQGVNE
jgi:RNA polymerase sigma-70 factor (ECF subfamily)